MDINKNLKHQEIILPDFNFPAGSYLSYQIIGDMVYVSGQTTRVDGEVKYPGRLGRDYNTEDGKEAARLCLKNILCQVKHACAGDLNMVESFVRLNVFVQSTEQFYDHAKVADGASDLLVEIFGDKGKHVRTSTGAISLPSNSAVEIDAIVSIKEKIC